MRTATTCVQTGYAGVVVDGVNASTGEANTVAINPQSHFFSNQGYVIHAADQYDASFVKLREMRLDYSLPADVVEGYALQQRQHWASLAATWRFSTRTFPTSTQRWRLRHPTFKASRVVSFQRSAPSV